MGKAIRNTIFTFIAIGLTSAGLSWNKISVGEKEPLLARRSVVSAEKSTNLDVALPLKVSLARSVVKVNQYQEVVVETTPAATVEITTAYPNGSINNPQTVRGVADNNGRYSLKYKLDNQAYLGVFQTTVNVSLNGRSAITTDKFVFQKWGAKEIPVDTGIQYQYPLVP